MPSRRHFRAPVASVAPGLVAMVALASAPAQISGAGLVADSGYGSVTGSAAGPIVIDGLFRDWRGVPKTAGTTFDDLAMAESDDFLFVHFRLPDEAILQAESDAVLLLDTDDDPATGRAVHGIGAEIEWRFGSRTGTAYLDGATLALRPSQLGLVTAPTVSTRRVELALERAARLGGRDLFGGGTIRGAVSTPLSILGLESRTDAFVYALGSTVVDAREPLSIERADPALLRVMNYNVERDGLFEPARHGPYRRVFQAIDPDIVAFQEIFLNPVQAAGTLLDAWLPRQDGGLWETAAAGTDAAIASRHPITGAWLITPGVDAYEVQPAGFDSDLIVIVVSLKCCEDVGGLRKVQIDAIQRFWRDAMSAGGEITVTPGTPMVMIGDMNLVGDAAELLALLRGAVFDPANGDSFDPDWDGSPLTDALPLHTDQPMAYTWRRDDNRSGFAPGRLDLIFYTDSVLRSRGTFVLHTRSMPGKRRKGYGLRRNDTRKASDHLPVVIDLEPR